MITDVVDVPPQDWRSAVETARSDGFGAFDWLGCVDEIGRDAVLRVVLMLRRVDDGTPRMLATRVPRDAPRLDSIGDLFAGARWHERESGELFGITFTGGDPRRLLLAPEFEGTPLRKEEVLAARTVAPWPGAKEPGETVAAPSRRRMAPPGVPDPAVWGDRDGAAAPADAAEISDSTAGGRVRRRR